MLKSTAFLLLVVSCQFVHSQIPTGLTHDLNGIPSNGYFDPLIYSPKKRISIIHNSNSYEVGHYYDSAQVMHSGLIRFENDKIFFKKKEDGFRKKITPEKVKYFVIGVDSFFVIKDFYYKNKLKEKPELVQYITEFNNHTFVKYYHFNSVSTQQNSTQTPILESFLVKHNDSLKWDNFPENEKFKERALKYFGSIPYLKDKISSEYYKSGDILSIIKMAEYHDKYKNSKTVLYDKYWQETRNIKKFQYLAKITKKTDAIWTFEYYKDNVKLYQIDYSSFYPNKKHGNFTSYYSNSEIRQLITFENDKPTDVKTFSENGLLKVHYQVTEQKLITVLKPLLVLNILWSMIR